MEKTKFQLLKPLLLPGTFLFLVVALGLFQKFDPQLQLFLSHGGKIPLHEILHTTTWLLFAWFLIKVFDVFLWEEFVEKRLSRKVPKLLKTVLNALIFVIVIIMIVGYVFNQSVTGLVATTGIVGIVLGMGLRSTIESACQGIALSVDRVIQIGDMVTVKNAFDTPAKVLEITWRSTILQDSNSNLIVVPNTTMCSSVVTNYSRPTHYSCFSTFISICVPPQFVKRLRRILESSLNSTNVILNEPPPFIYIADIADGSIKYQLQYSIDLIKTTPDQAKNELYKSIAKHFAVAGIGIEVTSWRYHDQTDTFLASSVKAEHVLQETTLFSALKPEETQPFASQFIVHDVKENEVVIRQGEPGSSMFVVAEGLFKVNIEDAEKHGTITVAKLVPGQYFGEMSLLVGEPRSATISAMTDSIVYEITKETMQRLFEAHPNLIQVLSGKMAERAVVNLQKKQAMLQKDIDANQQSYTDIFCKLIKKWFWEKDE